MMGIGVDVDVSRNVREVDFSIHMIHHVFGFLIGVLVCQSIEGDMIYNMSTINFSNRA